ncbi:unnamed protein product [Timema podura]|uniref:Uncharacterized protein n=1 Tax=Timema podura TaxID=61482 RepID=A0ABN7NQL5_TIMPD|nr:unnamed protein product [Timema podura]
MACFLSMKLPVLVTGVGPAQQNRAVTAGGRSGTLARVTTGRGGSSWMLGRADSDTKGGMSGIVGDPPLQGRLTLSRDTEGSASLGGARISQFLKPIENIYLQQMTERESVLWMFPIAAPSACSRTHPRMPTSAVSGPLVSTHLKNNLFSKQDWSTGEHVAMTKLCVYPAGNAAVVAQTNVASSRPAKSSPVELKWGQWRCALMQPSLGLLETQRR